MAMNRQRRTANISNIFSYDDAGNIVIKDYSQVIRYSWNGTIHGFVGQLSVSSVSAAVTDTDKFLVSDGGVLKFRTGAEVLSDIGAFILPSFTSGSVLFSNGTSIAQDNANFFWDDANNRLGIGTNAPTAKNHIVGAGATSATNSFLVTDSGGTLLFRVNDIGHITLSSNQASKQARFYISGYNTYPALSITGGLTTLSTVDSGNLQLQGGIIQFYNATGATEWGRFFSTGNLVLQNGGTFTDAGYRLDVNGTARIQSNFLVTNQLRVDSGRVTLQNNFNGGQGLYFADNSGNLAIGYKFADFGAGQQFALYNSGSLFLLCNLAGTALHNWTNAGNVNLGYGSTDIGNRLSVNGDAFIKGSGATSATNALYVQNSASSELLVVKNNGIVKVGDGAVDVGITGSLLQINSGLAYWAIRNSNGLQFIHSNISTTPVVTIGIYTTYTTGNSYNNLILTRSFTHSTANNAAYNSININDTINQTGGANGITRGLYVNPTLTAAADWRSIEWSNNSGWGIYGAGTASSYMAGNLLLGTTTDTGYRLQVTSASADSHLNVWGASAPSIRIDNAATGATQRFVFGLATATNNFIIGAVAGDVCMTTQSSNPLLFGANALEVMRITTSRNLLIGTQTDSGYRLDVSGTARISGNVNIGTNAISYGALQINGSNSANILLYDGYATTTIQSYNASAFTILNQIGATSTNLMNYDYTSKDLTFQTNGNNTRLTIASTGASTFSGDLAISGILRETVTANRQTASYSLVLADRGKLVEMNVATANNLTVPLNSSIVFPVGTKIDIAQYGAGQTTVVATGGVTIRSAGGALKLAAQYSGASLVKIGTDEWYLFGDITV